MATPKSRALGAELRRERERAFPDRSLRKVAEDVLRRHASVVSRAETGERPPPAEEAARWLTLYGTAAERYDEIMALTKAPDAPLWHAVTMPDQRQQLAAVAVLETGAPSITQVSPYLIPGLLQCREYSRSIMEDVGLPPDEVAVRVNVRVGRAEALTRDDAPTLLAILGEAALNQRIGGRDVLAAQLRHLLERARRPNVTVRVLPFTIGWHPATEGPFVIIDSREHGSVVHLETRQSGLFLHRETDVAQYEAAVRSAVGMALTVEDSAALIREYLDRLEAGT